MRARLRARLFKGNNIMNFACKRIRDVDEVDVRLRPRGARRVFLPRRSRTSSCSVFLKRGADFLLRFASHSFRVVL